MRTRLLCVIPLLIGLNCSPASGVWVRVAETGCAAVAELVTDDDTIARLCLVTIDLARLLRELRTAQAERRAATVRYVGSDGAPVVLVVPVRHLEVSALSVRAAMGAP